MPITQIVRPSTVSSPELDRLRVLEHEARLRGVRRGAELLVVAGLAAIGLTGDAGPSAIAAIALVLLASGLEQQAQRSAAPGAWLAIQANAQITSRMCVRSASAASSSPRSTSQSAK